MKAEPNAGGQGIETSEAEPRVQSPCVRNCCLDDNEVCLGCGRSLAEIVGWNEASEAERRAILARAGERQARRRAPG